MVLIIEILIVKKLILKRVSIQTNLTVNHLIPAVTMGKTVVKIVINLIAIQEIVMNSEVIKKAIKIVIFDN